MTRTDPSHLVDRRCRSYGFPIPNDIVMLTRTHVSPHAKGQAPSTLVASRNRKDAQSPKRLRLIVRTLWWQHLIWRSRPWQQMQKLATSAARTGHGQCDATALATGADATINCLPWWGYNGRILRKSWLTKMRTRQVTIERCSRRKGFWDCKHAVWVLRRSYSFLRLVHQEFLTHHFSVCAEATVPFCWHTPLQAFLWIALEQSSLQLGCLIVVHAFAHVCTFASQSPYEPWSPLQHLRHVRQKSFVLTALRCLLIGSGESKLPQRSKVQAPGEVAKWRVLVTLGPLRW